MLLARHRHMANPIHSEHAHGAILITEEDLRWVRQNAEYETAVLLGNPDTLREFYVMRYRTLVACDVPAHWHPEDEHVTVIAGEIAVGFGESFATEVLRPLAAGSYAMIPRTQPHFTRYAAGTIVQVEFVRWWSTISIPHKALRVEAELVLLRPQVL